MKKIISDFTEKLYKTISETGAENLLLSPLSVIYAAALVGSGASGETRDEIEKMLGSDIEKLDKILCTISGKLAESKDQSVKLANSLWTNKNLFRLSEKFAEHAHEFYDAECKNESFSDNIISKINAWVSEKTDGMITDALDTVDPSTAMILLNTILFDGKWEKEYHDVVPGEFFNYDGSSVQTEFMPSSENTYFENDGAAGFSKNYTGGYRFTAVLPDSDIQEYIKHADLESILSAAESGDCRADVSLPKFDYENETGLNEVLEKLGMRRALSPYAELHALSEDRVPLYIDKVMQKARIIVNERGTKAAAMTEMSIALTMLRPDRKTLFLDRPFIYMITDPDGVILFIGTIYSL